MGTVGLILVCALAAVLLRRALERHDSRVLARIGGDPAALQGTYTGGPALASLEHLHPEVEPPSMLRSPYRDDGEIPLRSERAELRRQAQTALSNARWLLMSAVEEALEADRLAHRGDHRGADLRTMVQNRAECEALQCVFEAEECLGSRIVREPEEPRRFARFYGRAAELLATVEQFEQRAFGSESSVERRAAS